MTPEERLEINGMRIKHIISHAKAAFPQLTSEQILSIEVVQIRINQYRKVLSELVAVYSKG
jgi:hypothetical protein